MAIKRKTSQLPDIASDLFESPWSQPSSGTSPSGSGANVGTNADMIAEGLLGNNSLLSALSQIGAGSEFTQLLAQLGVPGQQFSDAQKTDWNSELLKQILQAYLTQEQRSYDQKLWNQQNLYDSPTNQLARLMGAGISRDAAIQLLSGSAGGSGSGVPYGQTGNQSTLLPGTQSDLNDAQAKAAMINSVFGVIHNMAGAIGSLGTFGLSAASLQTNLAATRAATAGQVLSNTQLRKTLNGIETASTVVGAISSAYQAGIIDKDHTFGSSQEMLKYIRDNADKYEPFGSLVSSGMLDGIGKDVYSLDALNHAYESWRKTKDYNIDRKHIVNMQALDELFRSLDNERINSEIALNGQYLQESIQNVLNSIQITNADVVLKFAQASNFDAETDLMHQQFDMQQYDLDWLTANIDDINSVRTNQLMLDAACWNALRDDPKAWKAEVHSWLSKKENLRTAIALESIYFSRRQEAAKAISGDQKMTAFEKTAQLAVYWHNMISQAFDNDSPSPQEQKVLGNLSGSGVALWALRKYSRLP